MLNTENARDAAGLFDAGGEVVLIPWLDGKVMIFIGPSQVIAPPGPAGIGQRPDCDRGVYHGAPCEECDGAGWHVWKACPRCGGTAVWRYLDDRTRMRCRACGASWSLDYPGWRRSGSLSGCSRPASPRRHAKHKEGEAT